MYRNHSISLTPLRCYREACRQRCCQPVRGYHRWYTLLVTNSKAPSERDIVIAEARMTGYLERQKKAHP